MGGKESNNAIWKQPPIRKRAGYPKNFVWAVRDFVREGWNLSDRLDQCQASSFSGSKLAADRVEEWSGRRDSNPQPSAWEADALPLRHTRSRDEKKIVKELIRVNPRESV